MNKLKDALSEQPGQHIRAKEFLNEAIHWLEHIDFLTSIRESPLSYDSLARGMFLLNDVTSNYCALLNWMSLVSLIESRVSNPKIGHFVHDNFDWPRDVAETFMNCVRNPTMHSGRAYIWGEYGSNWRHSLEKHGADVDFKGAFDPNISRIGMQPMPGHPHHEEYIKAVHEVGYFQGRDERLNENGKPEVVTTFFFLGFRIKIEETVLSTFTKLKNMNAVEIAKFETLNIQTSLTRMPAPENGG